MGPDPDDLYAVLVKWARQSRRGTYAELSHDYAQRSGDSFPPRGSWDQPLGLVNRRLAATGAPALTGIVVRGDTDRPGGSFWGCASNVPARPRDEVERDAVWAGLLKMCLRTTGLATCPRAASPSNERI